MSTPEGYRQRTDPVTGWVGWVVFAAVFIVMIGALTAIQGLSAIFRDAGLLAHAGRRGPGVRPHVVGLDPPAPRAGDGRRRHPVDAGVDVRPGHRHRPRLPQPDRPVLVGDGVPVLVDDPHRHRHPHHLRPRRARGRAPRRLTRRPPGGERLVRAVSRAGSRRPLVPRPGAGPSARPPRQDHRAADGLRRRHDAQRCRVPVDPRDQVSATAAASPSGSWSAPSSTTSATGSSTSRAATTVFTCDGDDEGGAPAP